MPEFDDLHLNPEDYQEALLWLETMKDDPVLRTFQLREQSDRVRARSQKLCAWSEDLRARNATRRLLQRSGFR